MFTVYKLTFPDKRVYVGFTSQSLSERFDGGMGYLHSNGKSSRSLVAKAIVYFGWKNIKKEILAKTENLNEAQELEKKFIEEYRSIETQYGFNTQSGGKAGYDFNSEFLKSVKGIHKSINSEFKAGHKCFTNHPFVCLENGKVYINRAEAEKDLGVNLAHITEVCKGRRDNCKGYHFVYSENYKG